MLDTILLIAILVVVLAILFVLKSLNNSIVSASEKILEELRNKSVTSKEKG